MKKRRNIKRKILTVLAITLMLFTIIYPVIGDIEDYEDDAINTDPSEDWYTYSKYVSGSPPEFNVATLGSQKTFAVDTTDADATKVRNDHNFTGDAYTYYEFDMFVNSSTHEMGHICAGNGSIYSSGTSADQTHRINYIRFGDGTSNLITCYDDDNGEDNPTFGYPEDEWFHVRVNLNYTTQRYQIVLNTTFEGNWTTFGSLTEQTSMEMNNLSFGEISASYQGDYHIDNLTVHGLSDAGESGDWSNWSDTWTISSSHSCTETGYLYGNWSFSEHINETGDLEEAWTEANYSHWFVSSESAWWGGNYTYAINTTGINASFTVLNNSGMNRTQMFGWVHSNDTEVDAVYPFVIFAYNTSMDFNVVMWSSTEAWIFNWNGTNMTDIVSGEAVVDPSADGTDLSDQWVQEGVYLTDEGNYFKIIYNECNGSVKFKWWGNGFMSEPTGWTIQYESASLNFTECRCKGIGIWNPNERNTTIQWDLFNVWQLNYTRNASAWINISGHNDTRPHMNFPVINLSNWTEAFMAYFNDTFDGNVSIDAIRDIMKDNITNPMNMESRGFELDSLDNGQQNDTVYYYSCLLDNFTAFCPECYDEWLHIHVQMCPEDDIETDEYGDFMVGIDVDNDREWDINDRVYLAYVDDAGDVFNETYNGNGAPIPNIASWNLWVSEDSAVGNLHRYTSHVNYVINIPLADLVKENGFNLNVSDTFGLSIITTTSGTAYVTQDACVWQNWNETLDEAYYEEENNYLAITNYFFNCTGEIEGFLANATNLLRWGEGQIIGEFSDSGEILYNVSIEKYANITSVDSGSTYAWINYTVYVNNTGNGILTTVVVNDTKFNCSCHNFNESNFSSSVDWGDITNLSCYRLFANDTIGVGESWMFWYVVNVSNCSGFSTGVLRNNVSVNATELDDAVSTSASVQWGEYAERVCVVYTTDATDVGDIGNTVFTIIGVLLMLSAIITVIVVLRKYDFI